MNGLGIHQMSQQPASTDCWLVVAEFCSRCVGRGRTPLSDLKARFQNINAASANAMNGAGNPVTVLQALGIPVRREKVTSVQRKMGDRSITNEVRNWTAGGKPAILVLQSDDLPGWRHAVVAVGADGSGNLIAWKDPAHRNPNNIRYVRTELLLNENFEYATPGMSIYQMRIFAYLIGVIFVG